ncbi:hypothetical protein evm_003376 [Chilo suppressalis]|nr:hypothetical protein evm_003376 [Chilo suppressalis]
MRLDSMSWVDDQNSILFVKIVERFPDIYDNNTEKYRKWCAIRAWEKVAECVKNEMKITCTVDELKTRWKGIRSSYSRYLSKLNKSKQGDCPPPSKYYLSDALNFLIPYMKQKSSADNDTEEGPAFESCFTNEDDDSYLNNYEQNVWVEEDKKPDVNTIVDLPLSETEEDNRSNKINSNQNKRKRTKSNDSEVENEDLQFFKSIIPDIVNFTPKEKRRLKMGVLKLIDDIENDRD